MAKKELQFQNHIIDSYKNYGGLAKKWATEMQRGNPDLVCSLGGYGTHLAEVKHEPDFEDKKRIDNPLRPKQIQVCRTFIEAGSMVLAYVISGDNTLNSKLHVFHPLDRTFTFEEHSCWVPYVKGEKYDVRYLLYQYSLIKPEYWGKS